MNKNLKIIEKLAFATVFGLLFFSSIDTYAETLNIPFSQYDSMYKYNAIENTSLSPYLANNTNQIEEKLSTVSNSLEDDITKQLKDITNKQNFSINQIDNSINTINNKSNLKNFLIGNNLKVLNFQIVQINNLIFLLDDLVLKTENNENKIQINNQIKYLKKEQEKVNNFILEHKNRFSLFGWFSYVF